VLVVPAELVTVRFTVPVVLDVVVHVISVLLTIVGAMHGEFPSSTVAPVWNPVPVTVMRVPPAMGPDVGEIEVRLRFTGVVDGVPPPPPLQPVRPNNSSQANTMNFA
jgi:hypothetical protein